MFSFLDSIPVVGHVKGVVHYATGDTEAGNQAMLASTRSSVVMGAGAVGFVAGPVGSAALGASAGALWDTVESVATDKPTGLIANIENIVQTSSNGEFPLGGILETTLTVTGDVLGGLGGGSLASSATQAAGQSAVNTATNTATNTAGKTAGKSAANTAAKSAANTATKSAANTAAKSAANEAGKSAANTAAKSAANTAAKSAANTATKSAANTAAKSAANTAAKAAANEAGKSAANTAAKSAANTAAKSVTNTGGTYILKSASVPAGETFTKAAAKSAVNTASKTAANTAAKSAANEAAKTAANTAAKSAAKTAAKSAANTAAKSATKSMATEVTKTVIKEEGLNVAAAVTTRAIAKQVVAEATRLTPRRPPSPPSDPPRDPPPSSGNQQRSSSSTTTTNSGAANNQQSTSTAETTTNNATAEDTTMPSNTTENPQSTESPNSGDGGGSGQSPQPPDSNTMTTQEPPLDPMQEFLSIFEVTSLNDVTISEKKIFKDLKRPQRRYLGTLLKTLQENGLLKSTVNIIRRISQEVDSRHVNYLNFISMAEFIQEYLLELKKHYHQISRTVESRTSILYVNESQIVRRFLDILTEIWHIELPVNFRDIFCAVYHYFKHRLVGAHEMSVEEYYDIIQTNLEIITRTPEYQTLTSGELRFERYCSIYGTRFVIIIKFVPGRGLMLSTCLFLDDYVDVGERDGAMYVNGRELQQHEIEPEEDTESEFESVSE